MRPERVDVGGRYYWWPGSAWCTVFALTSKDAQCAVTARVEVADELRVDATVLVEELTHDEAHGKALAEMRSLAEKLGVMRVDAPGGHGYTGLGLFAQLIDAGTNYIVWHDEYEAMMGPQDRPDV